MARRGWLPKIDDCPPSLLHTLVAFAETGNVSRAARALGLEQPLVSRRLKAFLGHPAGDEGLLERVGSRGLRLTERGRELLPRIREVLARYEDLLGHLRGPRPTAAVVRLGLGGFTARMYLPAVLAAADKQDRWRLETRLQRGRERLAALVEARLDLAVVTHGLEDIDAFSAHLGPLATTPLARHPLVVLAHPETPPGRELAAWAAARPVPVEKLADWPLVGLDEQSGPYRNLRRALAGRAGPRLTQQGQPGGWALGREYARQRLGVALLPLPLVTAQDRQDFVVRGLGTAVVLEISLVTRSEPPPAALAEVVALFRTLAT